MKKWPVLLLFVVIFAACKTSPYTIEELDYGLARSELTATTRDSTTLIGVIHRGESILTIIKHTDSIPAKAGTQFGVIYTIKAREQKQLMLDITWEYPPGMKDKKGQPMQRTTFQQKEYTNGQSRTSYLLEEANEVTKGDWTLKISNEGKVLYTRVFHLTES